jgi:hypothetical protein
VTALLGTVAGYILSSPKRDPISKKKDDVTEREVSTLP